MTEYSNDCLVVDQLLKDQPESARPGANRRGCVPLLSLIILLGVGGSMDAQQYGPAYPQAGPAYPYPQGYQQPVQRNQYYNQVPGSAYYGPSNYNGNGNGITYYYVQNPNGPNYYPFTSPYGPPPPSRPNGRPSTWPAPANVPAPSPPLTPIDPSNDGLQAEARPAPIPYHRPTNDRFWLKADYLATFIRPMRTVPLATTGSLADPNSGAVDQPNSLVVHGNNSIHFNLFSGVRLEGGLFLDQNNRFSLDICGFWTFPNTDSFFIRGNDTGNPLIARPFFNVVAGREAALLTTSPGSITGTLSIDTKSEMAGIELNARYHTYTRERLHMDTLVGFRYLRLAERMRIQDQINPLTDDFLTFQGTAVNAPNSLADEDVFRTVNQFFGPQIGGRLSWEHGCFSVDGFAKLALGATEQRTAISGSTTLLSPNGNQTAVGGVLAQTSNIGNHNRTVLGIVPEFGLNVGVELTQHCRLHLGYSLLLWNHVVRPGGQIDRNVNPNQIPGSPTFGTPGGPQSPSYRFNDEFFWSQTLNLGIEFHY